MKTININPDTPVRFLPGVGPKRAELLNAHGILNVGELLCFFPRRHEDRKNFTPIAALRPGGVYTVKASVRAVSQRMSFKRRKFSLSEIIVGDDSGNIICVWFNRWYLRNYLHTGDKLILHGKVEYYGKRLQISAPEMEIISSDEEESLNAGRIVPVYSLPSGISQRYFRKIMKSALDGCLGQVHEFLPYDMRMRHQLANFARSLLNIHFPQDEPSRLEAYKRFSFEEFFFFQLPLAMKKALKRQERGLSHRVEGELSAQFIASLPFRLTAGQLHVLSEIKADMSGVYPMQRLLQGDVGSGKTIVALIAALIAVQSGHQAAVIAPTEILAKQHFLKVNAFLQGMGGAGAGVKCVLLAGAVKASLREPLVRSISSGEADIVVGTHSLLRDDLSFRDLGLVVIDEQHKFGVRQRAILSMKGKNPDVLIMTATPIPRTLAITLYGDLDVSVLTEMPPGRKPVQTLRIDSGKKQWLYRTIREFVGTGRQVYVVYPLVEESVAEDLHSVTEKYEEFISSVFPDLKIGMVHGQMKEAQQEKVMADFRRREVDILIATTILEVGIDVPNACLMVVENAERFGLAQLHQLRGRVGRGEHESCCVLVSDAVSAEANARLNAMTEFTDGFRIAEEDLKIRGPGEFFGSRQHGLTEMKVADPLTQMQLLRHARAEAVRIIAEDKLLTAEGNALLRRELLKRFPEYEKVMLIG